MTTSRAHDTGLDVVDLVQRAAAGESWAWERLVDQYSRLIWAITRDFKLVESDAADVAQVTWLRLLENIHKIENPDRVGSWRATTARNECLRCLANRKRVVLAEDEDVLQGAAPAGPEIDERLLLEERAEQGREAMTRLPLRWQRMLDMLMADPPASYAEISDQLGLPVGSIGPTRSRRLARLRVLLHSGLPAAHEKPGRVRSCLSRAGGWWGGPAAPGVRSRRRLRGRAGRPASVPRPRRWSAGSRPDRGPRQRQTTGPGCPGPGTPAAPGCGTPGWAGPDRLSPRRPGCSPGRAAGSTSSARRRPPLPRPHGAARHRSRAVVRRSAPAGRCR